MQNDRYVNKTIQKTGISGVPAYIEHVFAIWEAITFAKQLKENLYIVWLELANAYGFVPYALIHVAMDFFWIPEGVQRILMCYDNNLRVRFTARKFTTEWQRLEVGIAKWMHDISHFICVSNGDVY